MPLDIPFLMLVLTLVKISLMFIQRKNKKNKKKNRVNLTLVSKMLLITFNI
jgi:hypothetical protein